MGLRVNTNVASLNAQRNLFNTTNRLSRSFERLSSGLRINRAADDAAGLAISESFRAEITEIFPESELTEIPPDHPVFHTFYELPEGLPKIHEHDGAAPQALGIFHRGRLVVFYSYESDLGDGWEDEGVHEDTPETREQAIRMGVNLFLYVLGQSAS